MQRVLAFLCCMALFWPTNASAETDVIRIPRGAGGVGFLPLLVMERRA